MGLCFDQRIEIAAGGSFKQGLDFEVLARLIKMIKTSVVHHGVVLLAGTIYFEPTRFSTQISEGLKVA